MGEAQPKPESLSQQDFRRFLHSPRAESTGGEEYSNPEPPPSKFDAKHKEKPRVDAKRKFRDDEECKRRAMETVSSLLNAGAEAYYPAGAAPSLQGEPSKPKHFRPASNTENSSSKLGSGILKQLTWRSTPYSLLNIAYVYSLNSRNMHPTVRLRTSSVFSQEDPELAGFKLQVLMEKMCEIYSQISSGTHFSLPKESPPKGEEDVEEYVFTLTASMFQGLS